MRKLVYYIKILGYPFDDDIGVSHANIGVSDENNGVSIEDIGVYDDHILGFPMRVLGSLMKQQVESPMGPR